MASPCVIEMVMYASPITPPASTTSISGALLSGENITPSWPG